MQLSPDHEEIRHLAHNRVLPLLNSSLTCKLQLTVALCFLWNVKSSSKIQLGKCICCCLVKLTVQESLRRIIIGQQAKFCTRKMVTRTCMMELLKRLSHKKIHTIQTQGSRQENTLAGTRESITSPHSCIHEYGTSLTRSKTVMAPLHH
jgi:hypothetical protein